MIKNPIKEKKFLLEHDITQHIAATIDEDTGEVWYMCTDVETESAKLYRRESMCFFVNLDRERYKDYVVMLDYDSSKVFVQCHPSKGEFFVNMINAGLYFPAL